MNIEDKIRKLAGMGLHFMKEAVLEVLFHAKDGPPLPIWEITSRLQLFKPGIPLDIPILIVFTILTRLECEGKVYKISGRESGWIISNKEATRIRDYLEMEF